MLEAKRHAAENDAPREQCLAIDFKICAKRGAKDCVVELGVIMEEHYVGSCVRLAKDIGSTKVHLYLIIHDLGYLLQVL